MSILILEVLSDTKVLPVSASCLLVNYRIWWNFDFFFLIHKVLGLSSRHVILLDHFSGLFKNYCYGLTSVATQLHAAAYCSPQLHKENQKIKNEQTHGLR